MHALEKQAIEALSNCTFVPASSPKRFARDMKARLASDPALSFKQQLYLWGLVWRFRRQIYGPGNKHLVWAASLITGKGEQRKNRARYNAPATWLASSSGPIEQQTKAMISAYILDLTGQRVVYETLPPKQKKEDSLRVGHTHLTRRCGCEYSDGRIQKPCEAHSDTWKDVLSA